MMFNRNTVLNEADTAERTTTGPGQGLRGTDFRISTKIDLVTDKEKIETKEKDRDLLGMQMVGLAHQGIGTEEEAIVIQEETEGAEIGTIPKRMPNVDKKEKRRSS
jgi:hypothetical protein